MGLGIDRFARPSLVVALCFAAHSFSLAQSSTLDELLRGLRDDQGTSEVSPADETGTQMPQFLREPPTERPASPSEEAEPTQDLAPSSSSNPTTLPETTQATAFPEINETTPSFEEDEINPFLISNLDELLQRLTPEAVQTHLVFAGAASELNQEQVTLGAAIVQGIGLRTDLKPMLITYGPQLEPGRFNVLVGTIDQVGSVMGARLVEEIGESGLCMIPMPNYESEPVLVITGTSQRGINEAVLALGFVNMDLPAADFVSIRRILFPETPPYFGQPPVNPGETYTFLQLQQVGAPIRPVRNGGIGIQIYFPADVFDRPAAKVNLSVHFSVGQNTLRSSKAMEVRLNGTEVVRAPFGETTTSEFGGRYLNFSVPIGKFQSGRNLLEITTDAGSSSAFSLGPTGVAANDLLVFTDSTIEIPRVPRGAILPNLRLTSRTLYPFVGQPDGSEISFLLTNNEKETVEAAWMMIAKLSQISNTFLYDAEVSFRAANPDRHLVVIGSQSGIPTTLSEQIPPASFSELGSGESEDEAFAQEEKGPNIFQRFFASLANEFRKIEINEPADDGPEGAQIQEAREESIGPRAVMTSFPSPETTGRWILIVTARNDALLLERVRQLIRLPYWSQINGYLFSWNDTPNSVRAFLPDKRFSEVSFRETIVPIPWGYGVSLRIWYLFAAVVFLVFVLMTLLVLKHTDQTIAQRRKE
ncbi:MAG: cellulose biosynthesis cyclic di-GMP-binding regulatory protein BcsB [Verrucomicrobiota bacterium]